ncbi:hypothetical protein SERLA73DRAFT_175216 [Serpula lacrymans var. lacrymans S7.3]|uniref:Uncharacterized protein n=2 Tax=Serpula lacrymans var. lacrymans TaxID=341189 RepID=F8PL15_SERL3|nr:uncharacterized protein SERLADRAFT_457367 [Serpula lacrymans var. lacrymans S7.9]EGO03659.1 hypothetical protein SERLA73DRAFT_175216 [Serpula lacrymans var. lacrymans S7.3]EGO29525.1 hypothetical protein SERLADRAFT_457367 [Serpula lacrymans var. lacrymans S7.9]
MRVSLQEVVLMVRRNRRTMGPELNSMYGCAVEARFAEDQQRQRKVDLLNVEGST